MMMPVSDQRRTWWMSPFSAASGRTSMKAAARRAPAAKAVMNSAIFWRFFSVIKMIPPVRERRPPMVEQMRSWIMAGMVLS